jgi:hypothetical protein
MQTIDTDILETVTGGATAVSATNTNDLDRGTWKALKLLGREIGGVSRAQQQQQSQQQTMLFAAMLARRNG